MISYASVVLPLPLKTEFIYYFDNDKFDLKVGMRAVVPFGSTKKNAYVVRIFNEKPDLDFEIKEIIRVIDKDVIFTEEQYNLSLWMEKFYLSARGENLDTMVPGGKKDIDYGGLNSSSYESKNIINLTDEQIRAVETIIHSEKNLFYLYGITGSGKTEVFLRVAENVINNGGQVIYLVPEITLTYQLAQQVSARFKNKVAVLHSGLTPSQRIKMWREIITGKASLIIGARSAVFAPCKNLKLIILDEEHENSYKSSNTPRYHARQIAQKRISDTNGKLLMGSATPSLEAWYRMNYIKDMVELELTKRPALAQLPKIIVSDLNNEKGGGFSTLFGNDLIIEMNKVLLEGRQVILFLNRRGYSRYFYCSSCGYVAKCPHCDIGLVYHKSKKILECHHCGYKTIPKISCPNCHSYDVSYMGFGTEQVDAELERLFPNFKHARLDTDTVAKDKKYIEKILTDFKNNQIQILLGTQMVAKGLNFPNVKLVGIILADSTLYVPDFRASERTFQLLVQVSGRSGRADSDGEVIIQTLSPENNAIKMASKLDVKGFIEDELKFRKATNFPPFSRMIYLVFRSKNKMKAEKASSDFYNELINVKTHYGITAEIFNPSSCTIEKIRDNFRYQILIKSSDIRQGIKIVDIATEHVSISSSVFLEIDIDPLDVL